MRRIFTDEIANFIRERHKIIRSSATLTDEVNTKFGTSYTQNQIRHAKSNLFGKNYSKRALYPPEIESFLIENVKHLHNFELANLVNQKFGTNYTVQQIKNFKGRHKVKSYFNGSEGMEPYNKGIHYYPKGSEKTWFKKGHVPVGYREQFSERVDKDGYIEIKVDKVNTWEKKHRYLYAQAYGEIPKGYNVIFLDGDKRNFNLDNLALVSNSENAYLSNYKLRTSDKDITLTGVNIAKVASAIHNKKKEKKEENKNDKRTKNRIK